MKSQVEGVKQWNDNLNALAERGIATGLLDELKELGPSGASYVQAFIDMTKEELEEANDLYGTSAKMSVDVFIKNMESELNAAGELSKRISQLAAKGFNNNVITELKNLGPEASGYIATFMNMSSDEITKTNSMFDRKVAMVGETLLANMEAQLSSVKEWTTDMATLATKGLDGALLKQLGEMGLEGAEYVKAFLNMTTEEMSKVNALYTDSLSLPNTVASSIIASFSYAGTNAAKGFVKGIKDKTPSVAETAEKMATSALKAIKKKLGIHSPSKEFEKLGKYSDTGYVNGLKLYANKVNEAAEDVGNGALDSLRDSIAKISMYVDDGIDSNPVIRPVVDLSNVETGSKQINAMMSRQQSLQIGASMQSKWNSSSVPTSNTTNNNYQFTQNNYSPKALSRTEIYRQTRNQFSAMKGVMNS